MGRLFEFIKGGLLGRHLEFRVRLFNVLAMAGTLIGFSMSITGALNTMRLESIIVNVVCTVLSITLLLYSYRSGRYQFCYMVTIIGIFLILFPMLFFSDGGYIGGMPAFFVFAVLFTVFMLEGKKAIWMTAIELAVYAAICLIAYYNPDMVNWFESDADIVVDVIIGFSAASLSLGSCFFIHLRMYNLQHRELEKARKESEAANEAKSRFLANMSHEIRTPINVMLGMNEIIRHDSADPHIVRCSKSVEDAGQALLGLISNILDVLAIEKGKLEIVEEQYETADLVAGLAAVGEGCVSKYGLSFHVQVDEGLPRMLFGDIGHIRQVISNFLSNSAKYTKRGGVTLSLNSMPVYEPIAEPATEPAAKPATEPETESVSEPAAGGRGKILLRLAVSDTGIGIKADILPRLFEAFTRADIHAVGYVEGSGLGLAIAKECAGLMGGRIEVDSAEGRGSVFTLEVPQGVCDTAPIGKLNWGRMTESSAGHTHTDILLAPGCSALVVDDNSENLQVMKMLLSRTLLRVDTAAGGMACLEAAGKARYDLILMDYMMPGMDGVETLRRLRAMPGFDTPVAVLTANVVAGVKERLMSEGFDAYLSKPITWRDLRGVLAATLPQGQFSEGESKAEALVTEAVKDGLAGNLGKYGIELNDGLRYLSGDIALYGNLAALFVENFVSGLNGAERAASQGDWANLKFRMHSLKSRALNLGANHLYETAAKMERLCEAANDEHISVLLPMLYYEWGLARDGLADFSAALLAAIPNTGIPDGGAISLDGLLSLLKLNRMDALDSLRHLIEAAQAREEAGILQEIRQKVIEAEFREAERLLVSLIGSRADGQ